jgi:deazaflavin-dependent oxidoreductase (nitroreductase family)
MDLLTRLGYRYPKRNAIRRGVVRLASTPAFSWLSARVLPTLDRLVLKLSGGRTSFSEIAAGTPVVVLTTRGARTGEPRTGLLLGIPLVDNLALIGTNFAEPGTPSWVHNLLAHPRATVTYRHTHVVVNARELAGAEYEQVFAAAALIYPGYREYRTRLKERSPKVFVLEPAIPDAPLTSNDGPT